MAERIKNQYEPDVVTPPGDTLQETIDALGMSQAELAERTGRPKKTINEIVKGKAAITHESALQFERVLGVPASFWNNRELRYREYLARKHDADRLSQTQCRDWVRRFPVAAMTKLGWIRKCAGPLGQLRELLTFFGIAGPEQWEDACALASYRKSSRSKAEPLSAWLRRGHIVAQGIDCAPYEADRFRQVLRNAREWTRLDPVEFVPKLTEECAKAGVAVAFVQELPGGAVSGATRWLTPTKALLQLSLRYKTNDHLWFTFFHEAGHIVLHGKGMFLEGTAEELERSKEEEADKFATDHLIPQTSWVSFLGRTGRPFSASAVTRFADELGIAAGIVVGRLQHEKLLPFSHLYNLKVCLSWGDGTSSS